MIEFRYRDTHSADLIRSRKPGVSPADPCGILVHVAANPSYRPSGGRKRKPRRNRIQNVSLIQRTHLQRCHGNRRTCVNRAVLVRAQPYRPRYVDVSRCAGWPQAMPPRRCSMRDSVKLWCAPRASRRWSCFLLPKPWRWRRGRWATVWPSLKRWPLRGPALPGCRPTIKAGAAKRWTGCLLIDARGPAGQAKALG